MGLSSLGEERSHQRGKEDDSSHGSPEIGLSIFKTHTYRYANKFYLQKRGGPISLRSTCCIARLVMMWWDERFLEVIRESNVKIIGSARYMDDVRVWLRSIRLGWRWQEGRLVYKNAWRLELLNYSQKLINSEYSLDEKGR